ncbi:snRNA-activating protein complex subunit 3 [Caenorhabditis elegans]|uniref:snRNA-activating protein complex subunit 3 n=1 Tax=Caenorhabditis elegans TaxID=6239 RepID=Q22092_CAEEL|nr:snRNA-activating protein complex subunit 3 [Caenorhabditis elegans]CAA84674.1 snRNA-activating protein complex subunit 3 [Caenorhabditis elegans]|eukprot:NP_497807.1 SNAPc (Small Nuclear RNA Activating Complex) homolog [Caenorhabditis elegans]
MDRKFNSDEQWYISPLLNLATVKEEMLEVRELGEVIIDRTMDDFDSKTEKEHEMEMWKNSLSYIQGVTEEESLEAIEEVSNLDMFLEGSSDVQTRRFEDMKGDRKFLERSPLVSHKHVISREKTMKTSRQRKSAYVTSLKYDKYMLNAGANTSLFHPQCSILEKCEDDIVLIVDALMPYNRELLSSELRSSRLLKPMTKFLVRGDTLLSDLRQKFVCQSDTIVPLENGLELDPPNLDNATAVRFPSSFIFVHDTFYVDMPPNAIDISHPIRNFMLHREIYDPVEACSMEGVRIIDLKLRLGQPYIFQHSGNCEHLLVFHDLRLLHESDPWGIDKYPFTLYEKGNEKKCDICKKGHVEFVVERHELLPNTYTHFCRTCFQEFNYVHGVKTHSFIAWPYTELQTGEQRGWPFGDFEQEDD